MQDSRTQGVTVDVCCTDGCICLIGRVDSAVQKDTAEMLVGGVLGVKAVLNNLSIRGKGKPG